MICMARGSGRADKAEGIAIHDRNADYLFAKGIRFFAGSSILIRICITITLSSYLDKTSIKLVCSVRVGINHPSASADNCLRYYLRDHTQVYVPPQGDDVAEQHAVVWWDDSQIDGLGHRPHLQHGTYSARMKWRNETLRKNEIAGPERNKARTQHIPSSWQIVPRHMHS
jgi:hypothetical protein